MNTKKQRIIAILFLVMSVGMSGCGPGQFLGPTVTPVPTPTNTPIPFGTLMLNNGFEVNSGIICQDGPCQSYVNNSIGMEVTQWDSGKFELREIMLSTENDATQLIYSMNIIYSLYPKAVADAIMVQGDRDIPYNGEIDGYKYNVYLQPMNSNIIGTYNVLVVLITPTR